MAKRNVVDFKIINLSEEKFQELKESGQIDPNALYATPDTTKERLDALETTTTALEENKQDKGDYATNTALSQTNQTVDSLQETKQDKATAVKYDDTEFIAHQAMPSDRYVELTRSSTSPTTITAPADGYIVLVQESSSANSIIRATNTSSLTYHYAYAGSTGAYYGITVPVSKGTATQLYFHNAADTVVRFRFIYANGAK